MFKRILGQYNAIFDGYGQHDSQECINTILDFMSEDLYKHEKKPYVEETDTDGLKPVFEEVAGMKHFEILERAWQKIYITDKLERWHLFLFAAAAAPQVHADFHKFYNYRKPDIKIIPTVPR